MGGGGGGHTTAETTSYTSTLPEYAEPYYKDLLSRTQQVSEQGYIPYEDQRIAEFDPATETAYGQVENIAVDPRTGLQTAQETATGVATGGLEGYDLSGYINPYVQQTLDVQSDMARRRYQEQQASRDAAAVQAGAFGGSRGAVADALAQRDLNEQLIAQEAQGMQAAYDAATQNYLADQQMRLSGAQQLAGMEQLDQQMGLEAAQALAGVGAERQAQEQRGLDQAYQDFVNQRDFERQQLAFYSQIMQGTPVTPQSEVVTSQPSPSGLSQLLGSGLGAAGLYGLLQ